MKRDCHENRRYHCGFLLARKGSREQGVLTSVILLAALFMAFSLVGCGGENEPTVISTGGKTIVIADSSSIEKAGNPWQVTLKATKFVRLSTQLPETSPEQFKSYLQDNGVAVSEYVNMGGNSYTFFASISQDTTLNLKNRGVLSFGGGGTDWQSPNE